MESLAVGFSRHYSNGTVSLFSISDGLPQNDVRQYTDMLFDWSGTPDSEIHVCELAFERSAPNKRLSRTLSYYAIRYVIDGEGFFSGQSVKKGMGFLSMPNQTFSVSVNPACPSVFLYISFSGKNCAELLRKCSLPMKNAVFSCPWVETMLPELKKILYAKYKNNETVQFTCRSFLYSLFTEHCRELNGENATQISSQSYVDQACSIIAHQYAGPLTIQSIAECLHITSRYLTMLFQRHLSCSPQQYLLTTRMEAAQKLLRSTKLSVAEVGSLVGYEDSALFSKMFTRFSGTSPLKYRNNNNT